VLKEVSKRISQSFDKVWEFEEEKGISSGEAVFFI